MIELDGLVIGAGVVGLAVARALAREGREVIVVEAEPCIGSGISSRSSEVIHAGLYYAPGSRKARWCVEGRERLYAYCAERGIAHRRCGKLIVATRPEQVAELQRLQARAAACGVEDLRFVESGERRRLEPALRADAALLSPSTGIVDSHALMLALLGEAEDHGARLVLRTPVLGGRCDARGLELRLGGDDTAVRARVVVNAAGLGALALLSTLADWPGPPPPAAHRCKGSYFGYAGRPVFSRLVYPVPEAAGLGVHVTLDLAGRMRFGPDVEWLPDGETSAADLRVDPRRAEPFYAAIRRYWPGLPDGSLQPDYAGIRPKLQAAGEPARDFELQGPEVHRVPGLWNLLGIESPGLTAALAIGEAVAAELRQRAV